jgi:outer membrane protein
MTSKTLAAGVTALALAAAASASAQQPAAPAAAPAAPTIVSGPPIAGVCVVNLDQVVAESTVGKYIQQRLQQIQQQASAEVKGENDVLNNDARALDAQRATLDQTTFEQRGAAIQVRAQALQRKVQQRERELQATEQRAIGRVLQESTTPVQQAYQQKGCSLLFQQQAILGGFFNPAMNITAQVVTALNAKITQFPFERERLDQQVPTAAPAGAAPPIVQTPAPAAPRPAPKK